MNWISPATLIKPESLEYRAPGEVFEVYDTNGTGSHIPVEFTRRGDGSKFRLKHAPHGAVYAQHPGPKFAGMKTEAARHPLLCRWWLRTRHVTPVYFGGQWSACQELYVPWWAWPFELAHRAVFGRSRISAK
jgi:hypothetical protein